MYTNSGNRILTKYSDFLKQTQGAEGILSLDLDHDGAGSTGPSKKRVNSASSLNSSSSSSISSGRTNSSTSVHGNCKTSHSTVNAQVHQVEQEVDETISFKESSQSHDGIGVIKTSKFSELFSPSESNALYMRNQLINSEDGRFLQQAPSYSHTQNLDNNELIGYGEDENDSDNAHIEDSPPAAAAAIPLLPPQYSTTSLQRSLDSGTSSINPDINSVTLRRELLNNIRAITKATYFEDIYQNNGAPPPHHTSPFHPASLPELPYDPNTTPQPQTIVSERGEYLVFETQLPLSPRESNHGNNVTGLDQTKLASIDEWIRNSQENLIQGLSTMSNEPIDEEIEIEESESENLQQTLMKVPEEKVEEVSEFQRENNNSIQSEIHITKTDKVPDYYNYRTMMKSESFDNDKLSQSHSLTTQSERFGKVPDLVKVRESDVTNSYGYQNQTLKKVPSPLKENLIEPHDLNLQLHDNDELLVNPDDSTLIISSPIPSTSNSSTKTHNTFSKVHYPIPNSTILPAQHHSRKQNQQRSPRPPLYGVKLPGILRRQNMDQWVAKILRFYINGDEHAPKYEFRFRPGRDVRSWDGLCDTLSERLKLSRGVRYIFTLDGQLVESLEQLKHGRAYVVSSNKKFKALNYGGEVEESSGNESEDPSTHRPPSAPPTQKHPPIIRVRRERSLNGVAWGSPQQLSNTSGSETNNNIKSNTNNKMTINPNIRIGPAESVVQAAIDAASSRLGTRVTLPMKQVVRIINGTNPNIQSQVLLNTRVSQDWNDLVKDLGLSVKISRNSTTRLETLVGRQIQSYSQLRSELKVGNNAFYIYVLNKNGDKKLPKINDSLNTNMGRRSTSHPTIYQKSQTKGVGMPPNPSPRNFNSTSTPNLTMRNNNPPLNVKRKSHRKRSQASTYLAPNHRSRSPSPF